MRERGQEQVRLWDRVALLRQMWGIPLPASSDRDETYACILACFCEVVYYNKLTLNSTVGDNGMYDVLSCYALALNHSCMPNVHLRFAEDDSGRTDNSLYNETLVVYAQADIKVGEEVATSYSENFYAHLAMMQGSLHMRHGFECRICPRCRDSCIPPMFWMRNVNYRWTRKSALCVSCWFCGI